MNEISNINDSDGTLMVTYSIYHNLDKIESLTDVWDILLAIRKENKIDGVTYKIESQQIGNVIFHGSRNISGIPMIVQKLIRSVLGDVFNFREELTLNDKGIVVNSKLIDVNSSVCLNIRTNYDVALDRVIIRTRVVTGVKSRIACMISGTLGSAIVSVIRNKIDIVRKCESDHLYNFSDIELVDSS